MVRRRLRRAGESVTFSSAARALCRAKGRPRLFGAQAMKQGPWAIIMEGDGNVTERKLADQSPGVLLPSTVHVVSNTVADGKRTVVMTRALKVRGGHNAILHCHVLFLQGFSI
jgi:hypothetical protein